MLTKIIKIGKLYQQEELFENFAKTFKSNLLVTLYFDLGPPVQYISSHIIEPPENLQKLLYYDQKGNVSGKSPTVSITFKNEDGSEKIRKGVEKAILKLKSFFKHPMLKDFENCINDEFESIVLDVEKLLTDQKNLKGVYLTVKLLRHDSELFPSEHGEFVKAFIDNILKKSVEDGEEGICTFCGRKKIVSATVNEVFKFATFDKPGFCPSLKKDDSIKVLPICDECKSQLQNGANKVIQELSFNFLKNQNPLWVIPSIIEENSEEILKNVIQRIADTSKKLKDFANSEREIELVLSEEKSTVHYDFLFMELNQNQQRIELHLTEISPTRLKKIVQSIDDSKRRIKIDDLPEPSLGMLWKLYEKPSGSDKSRKDYLALVKSIFQEEPYSYSRLLWYFMRKIRKSAITEGAWWRKLTYVSFAAILHLNQINVLNLRRGEYIVSSSEIDQFFNSYPEFFNLPWKKAVFLTGVLAGKVLSVQYAKRQATPFFKKFKGLKMNMQDVMGLLADIRNKLQQYDAYGKKSDELLKTAAEYYLQSSKSNTTIDELNFIFTLGLAYAGKEPFKKYEEVEEYEQQI
ncbi:TIGR02556 family CRISPR-associated protein [Pseudothermotoga elfii]|uniref:TIGR02556 family CRISPR-associated protein n=1 Tax=Pseudothermotoga elfii TaxID=38322 RepID=UPI0004085072|nr:TIGR02556 family CRISPR-associated protein [Pseudothermotoga elfii]